MTYIYPSPIAPATPVPPHCCGCGRTFPEPKTVTATGTIYNGLCTCPAQSGPHPFHQGSVTYVSSLEQAA